MENNQARGKIAQTTVPCTPIQLDYWYINNVSRTNTHSYSKNIILISDCSVL